MKNKLTKINEWILSNTNKIFRGIILNVLYFVVMLGGFISYSLDGTTSDWQWWLKVFIFAIIINMHAPINNFIRKYGW